MAKDRSDGQAAAAGFPLTALFLLTAFCSVLAGMLVQVVRAAMAREIGAEALAISVACGAFVGLLAGGTIGLLQQRPLVGLLVGAPTCFVLGGLVGPLPLLPSSRLGELWMTAIGGSAALIVFAVVIRAVSGSRPTNDSEAIPPPPDVSSDVAAPTDRRGI